MKKYIIEQDTIDEILFHLSRHSILQAKRLLTQLQEYKKEEKEVKD